VLSTLHMAVGISPTSCTALFASNLLAQFSRQIVIQIHGLETPKVCGNLALATTAVFYVGSFHSSTTCARRGNSKIDILNGLGSESYMKSSLVGKGIGIITTRTPSKKAII
jgi:hypothetical protein